ncbi:hypothetical protein DC345_26590 [Paenibacillus taichungensis]|uniref:Uncharacterized protein n=1 Tax=Paenibacillus taichungensis TaxID=484184 RepID=A0A329QF37_9BACL|nr:hypothetical protein DC345_26590 [Paenibacillus taichungensis]
MCPQEPSQRHGDLRERGEAVSAPVFKGSRAKGNGDLRERGEAVSVPMFKGSRAKGNGDLRERGEAVSVPMFKGSRAKGNGDLRERGEAVSVPVFKGSRAKGNGDPRERGEAVSAFSWWSAVQETGNQPESWTKLRGTQQPSHSKTRPFTIAPPVSGVQRVAPSGALPWKGGFGRDRKAFKKVGILTLKG